MSSPAGRRHDAAVLITCVVGSALTHLEATMTVVAVPAARAELGASDVQVHWVITAYLACFALVLLIAGRLGDLVGRRLMYVVGQSLMLAGSIAAASSLSPEMLIAARCVQGVGAGVLLPQGSAVIQSVFSGAARARAFALLGVAISVATAVGPLLAGVIVEAATWRWIYAITAAGSIVILVLAVRAVPGRSGQIAWRRLDGGGALVVGLGVVALMWPFVAPQTSALRWLSLVALPFAIAAIIAHHRRRAAGMSIIDLDVIRLPQYRGGVLVATLFFAGSTAVPAVLAIVLQESRGATALLAGALTAPWAVGNGLAAPWGARWVMAIGRRVVFVGALAAAVAVTVIAVVVAVPGVCLGLLAAAMLVGGIGAGLTIGPNLSVTLDRVPQASAGSASAMMQTCQRIGATIGPAAALALLFTSPGADGTLPFVAVGVIFALAAATAWAGRRDGVGGVRR